MLFKQNKNSRKCLIASFICRKGYLKCFVWSQLLIYWLLKQQQNVLKAVQDCFQHVKSPRNVLTDLWLGVMCTKKYLRLGSTNNDNNIQMKICRKGNDTKHYLKRKDLKNVKWRKLSPLHSMWIPILVGILQAGSFNKNHVNSNTGKRLILSNLN